MADDECEAEKEGVLDKFNEIWKMGNVAEYLGEQQEKSCADSSWWCSFTFHGSIAEVINSVEECIDQSEDCEDRQKHYDDAMEDLEEATQEFVAAMQELAECEHKKKMREFEIIED